MKLVTHLHFLCLPERDYRYVTFGYLLSQTRLSCVRVSSVCHL